MNSLQKINFNLNNINCFEENHQNNLILRICNDKNCNIDNKFMCSDCMYDKHNGHIGIKSKEIEEIVNNKLNDIYYNDEKNNFIKKFRKKIDEYKEKINQYFEKYYTNFIQIFKENIDLNKNNLINNIFQNYPPKKKEQLLKLQQILLNIYKEEKEIKNENRFNIYNIYEKIILNRLNYIDNIIKELLINKFILEKNFEWSKDTYARYDFYYELEENNTKITKKSADGTITICRGINNLEKGNIYKLDYFINYKDGDFDIGFGDDCIGSTCTLRTRKSYCVSNYGIYVNGINKDSSNYLVDNIKVTFIVDLINYSFDILFNDDKKFNYNINSQLVYYPMAAIKYLDNSVKLKVYKI